MISSEMMTKILRKNFEKRQFSQIRKNGFKKDLPTLPPREFVHVYIIDK